MRLPLCSGWKNFPKLQCFHAGNILLKFSFNGLVVGLHSLITIYLAFYFQHFFSISILPFRIVLQTDIIFLQLLVLLRRSQLSFVVVLPMKDWCSFSWCPDSFSKFVPVSIHTSSIWVLKARISNSHVKWNSLFHFYFFLIEKNKSEQVKISLVVIYNKILNLQWRNCLTCRVCLGKS